MNASSFIGQLCSTVLIGYLSVPTLIVITTFCCTVILFGMIGVHTVAGVVVFGIFYGYFSGLCTSFVHPARRVPHLCSCPSFITVDARYDVALSRSLRARVSTLHRTVHLRDKHPRQGPHGHHLCRDGYVDHPPRRAVVHVCHTAFGGLIGKLPILAFFI